MNGFPFGYGNVYNEDNNLIYSGVVFKGKKVCFGEEFYPDTETVEYRGVFVNDLRHGKGCIYD